MGWAYGLTCISCSDNQTTLFPHDIKPYTYKITAIRATDKPCCLIERGRKPSLLMNKMTNVVYKNTKATESLDTHKRIQTSQVGVEGEKTSTTTIIHTRTNIITKKTEITA